MQNAPDQQVMNDAYDHALWLRRCQSPLDQRDRMLCDLGFYVSQLLAALEKGQENCDAVYDELREDRDRLSRLVDTILTDPGYEGGVQFWIQKHDDLMMKMVSGEPATKP